MITSLPASQPWKPHRQLLSVLKSLRHFLAQSFREEKSTEATEESAEPEYDWGEVAQEEDVGGQHGSRPTHHHGKPHPDPAHHGGELLGREEVEDGV